VKAADWLVRPLIAVFIAPNNDMSHLL